MTLSEPVGGTTSCVHMILQLKYIRDDDVMVMECVDCGAEITVEG